MKFIVACQDLTSQNSYFEDEVEIKSAALKTPEEKVEAVRRIYRSVANVDVLLIKEVVPAERNSWMM
jgi:hypothetical protein